MNPQQYSQILKRKICKNIKPIQLKMVEACDNFDCDLDGLICYFYFIHSLYRDHKSRPVMFRHQRSCESLVAQDCVSLSVRLCVSQCLAKDPMVEKWSGPFKLLATLLYASLRFSLRRDFLTKLRLQVLRPMSSVNYIPCIA